VQQVAKVLRHPLRPGPGLVLTTFDPAHSLGLFRPHLCEHRNHRSALFVAYVASRKHESVALQSPVVRTKLIALGGITRRGIWRQLLIIHGCSF